MCVGVHFARNGGDDVILLLHAGVIGGAWGGHWTGAVEVIRFCHYSERFLEDFPQLDRLV